MKFIFITLLILLSPIDLLATESEKIAPFTSDGCSMFPEGTLKQQQLWHDCCVAHDKAYWAGGSYQQRKQADIELKQCVAEVGEPEIAQLMLAGVRVGGSPFWPTRFRWGYGWPYGRGYRALTEAEQQQVAQKWQDYLSSLTTETNTANSASHKSSASNH